MKILISIVFFLLHVQFLSGENRLLINARNHYNNKEYFHAITEIKRYQHLYKEDTRIPESMILMGKAYYMGGNVKKAQMVFKRCYYEYPKTISGSEGLYYSGLVRLLGNSPYFAIRDFQEYNYVYKDKKRYEDSLFNLCTSYAVTEKYSRSLKCIEDYKEAFPEGKYLSNIGYQEKLIESAISGKRKNPYIAGISSAIIPGSGYLYTGKYKLGFFSMATNATLLYLIYDSYRSKNTFGLIFFSIIEFSFYNYSIVGSIGSAREYNENYNKDNLLLGIKRDF